MNKGEISVLMAVYNCEKTIRQSIDSVLAQTYTNWKLIICDDCSDDKTYEIICQYSEEYPGRFIIIKNDVNSKLPYTLNKCLKYVEGEYCARMDGDDYISCARFEKQVAYLKNHPQIDLVGTNMRVFYDDGELGREIKYKDFPSKYDLRRGPCFAHASIMTYPRVYHTLGGYTVSKRTERCEDLDLWFRFFEKGFNGANIQEDLYYVRENRLSYLRRKPITYIRAFQTRLIGYKKINMPMKYYPSVVLPLVAMFGNEARKIKASLKAIIKKQ